MDIKISIRRAHDAIATFRVPHQDGMSLLDALRWISAHAAPDLAYRWECGGQRICGVCTMRVNGEPLLSCAVTVAPGTDYLLEPLAGFPIAKDLIVDLTSRLDALQYVNPYLTPGGEPIRSHEDADASKLLRSCVECWACVSVCPISLNTDHADALGMVKLARFARDPRDGADRPALAAQAGLDVYTRTCPSCRACMDVCPKAIDVYLDAVKVLADG